MSSLIEIQDLHLSYENKEVLRGLSLSVNQGEIFGFLGSNGAGKSTTIKTLLGLIFPKSGLVRVMNSNPQDVKVKSKIGYLPEEATYYRYLKPIEILSFYGNIFGIPPKPLKKRIHELLELVGLQNDTKKTLAKFSKGMCQKLGLAQALINDPHLMILDEPMTGLDPIARVELRNVLSDLKDRGKTIFFSSHELSQVELVCDSICIVNNGVVVKSGGKDEFLNASQYGGLEQFFIKTIKGE